MYINGKKVPNIKRPLLPVEKVEILNKYFENTGRKSSLINKIFSLDIDLKTILVDRSSITNYLENLELEKFTFEELDYFIIEIMKSVLLVTDKTTVCFYSNFDIQVYNKYKLTVKTYII